MRYSSLLRQVLNEIMQPKVYEQVTDALMILIEMNRTTPSS